MKKRLVAALFAAGLSTQVHAEEASCLTVRSADMGWTDIALTTNTASFLLKTMGYQMNNTLLGLNVAYESLKTNQIDVFLGNWRPAQDTEFKDYFDKHWVDVINVNLTGAKYTLAVPSYVADGGVHSFDDLAKFPDKFDKKIYGIEPGTNQPLLDMVAAGRHGLKDWQIVESSEQGMLAQVKRSIARNEWIVFLGWQPHPMNLDLKMTYLSGGDVEFGPDFGGSTVRTLSRVGYAAACPNVAHLFKNLVFDIDYENQGMRMITGEGMEADAAAKALLKAHPDKLATWLDGVSTADGKPALEAVRAALAQ